MTAFAIVYKYGLIAEFIGKTNETNQANAAGDRVMTLVWTKIPRTIIGDQHQKSVATMAATRIVNLICFLTSWVRPDLFDDLLTDLKISM